MHNSCKKMNSTNLFAISALVNGIVSITFGILVISKNWRDRMNQIFFLMTIFLAIWSFSYWRWQLAIDYDAAMFWVRMLSVGSLFIPILFYHWIIKLLNVEITINKIILWLSYVMASGMLFFVDSNLFIASLEKKSFFQFWPNSGIIYDVYFSYIYFGLILYTIYILLRSYHQINDRNKKGQVLYIIISCILGFGGVMTDFPLWWGINIPPYGNILAAVFPFLLGYSILKYKLFNVRAIISEILVFFIAVVLLIEAILSTSIAETIIKFSVFIIVSVFGYILIRSVYREISQREKIQLLATDLQTANDAQVNLIHIMNHQIKGRFSDARSAFAMLLEGEYGVISEEAKVILQKGLEQTEIGVDYVQGILKGLSATNGTLPYDMKDLDLKALIKSVTDRLASKATEKKLKFEVNLADGDFKINGDGIQLSEVVGNLINNSIAYTPAGSIHVWLTKKGNKALVAVQDTGVGITEEDKLKLFKTGGRGKDSIKVNINSTGYGLSFVKGVVEAHKGRVWAESDGPGKGSSFYMEVPLIG